MKRCFQALDVDQRYWKKNVATSVSMEYEVWNICWHMKRRFPTGMLTNDIDENVAISVSMEYKVGVNMKCGKCAGTGSTVFLLECRPSNKKKHVEFLW